MEVLGASFQDVPEQTRRQLNIGYGVQVSSVNSGLMKDAGIQRGYIILRINEQQIKSDEGSTVANLYATGYSENLLNSLEATRKKIQDYHKQLLANIVDSQLQELDQKVNRKAIEFKNLITRQTTAEPCYTEGNTLRFSKKSPNTERI